MENESLRRDKMVIELLNLHKRLKETKASKKSMVRDYKDQIKEIESDIEDIVDELVE